MMQDYDAMTEEILEFARRWNPPETIPHHIKLGESAYRALAQITSGARSPGLPSDPGFCNRSLLQLSGLPMYVEEDWPKNMFAVLNDRGDALLAGVLNEAPERADR